MKLDEIIEDACCNYYHPNSKGHEIIAQAHSDILKWIKEKLPKKDISIDAIKLPEGISAIEQGGYKEPYVEGLEKGIKEGVKQYRQQTLKNLGIKEKE